MSKTLEMNAGTVVLIIVIFAVSFLLFRAVYNVFRDCVQYTTSNGWNVLSKTVVVLWLAPMAIPFLLYHYSATSTMPSWVLPVVSAVCAIWLLILIVGTMKIMGLKYGFAVSVLRIVLSVIIGLFGAFLGALVVVGGLIASMGIAIYTENSSAVLIGPNGNVVLNKMENGGYYDQFGNTYYPDGTTLHCSDGNIYWGDGHGNYYCENDYYYRIR